MHCRFWRQVQEQRIISLTWHSIASFHWIRMDGPSPFEQSYFPNNHREISSNLAHNISHTQPLKEWCLEDDPLLFWLRKSSVKWWDFRKNGNPSHLKKDNDSHACSILFVSSIPSFSGPKSWKSWENDQSLSHSSLSPPDCENKPTKLANKILMQKNPWLSKNHIEIDVLPSSSPAKVPEPNDQV